MKRVGRFFTLSACVMTAIAAQAHAQTSEPSPPPSAADAPAAPPPLDRQPWREAREQLPPENPDSALETREWYGWQTLLCDAVGVGLIAIGETEPAVAGLGVIVLGSPIVHFAHSNTTGGLISFAIRGTSLGLAVLGSFLIFANDEDGRRDATETLGVVSLIASGAGALAALVLDASLFGFETKTQAKSYTATSVAPWVDPKRGSYGVRVGFAL